MSILEKIRALPTPVLICFLAPLIALICIQVSIMLAPMFVWADYALSDLGHYTRTDIGLNPLPRAIVFNAGIILTSLLMLYYTITLLKKVDDVPTKIGLIPFAIACAFLLAIGIFSENFNPIHFYVSVGFFFTFPWAMWLTGLSWLRFQHLRWFAVISIILPFLSIYLWLGYFGVTMPWTGAAIPEILTAFTAIGWIWVVTILHLKGRLTDIVQPWKS
jgi:hypothetical membrane protein